MPFKYPVGQLVEYTPPSEMPGLYRIARQMPVEDAHVDLAYLIKPERKGFDRVVLECNLSADVLSQEEYDRMPARHLHR
jgi:hypothetical protein